MTVQSTMGVAAVRAVDPAWLVRTLEHVSVDLPAAGVKIGMLASDAIVQAVAGFLREVPYQVPVVIDPVLRSSSGHQLLESQGERRIHSELLPLAGWITPNWAELSILSGVAVRTLEQARDAANVLGKRHPRLHIVATAGDQKEPVDLLRIPGGAVQTFAGEHVETTSTHGTGCAFSSALLCRLILGDALRSAPGLGRGRGPLDLLWPLRAARRNC
jgi:hydroxymethylpyrimidine/phosphomethylpyrimidine kinase